MKLGYIDIYLYQNYFFHFSDYTQKLAHIIYNLAKSEIRFSIEFA
jgi:hypothetical protein